MARPTDDEIEDTKYAALDDQHDWSGMRYQQGVADALDWVLGNGENPIEEN